MLYIFLLAGIGCIGWLITCYENKNKSLKNIVIANTPEETRSAVLNLKRKCLHYPVLGFDCEWITDVTGRRPVALLQLASVDGYCVLIRLCRFMPHDAQNLPIELKRLLADSHILKVGVVPCNDAEHLLNDYGIIVRGCLDLQYLVLNNDRYTLTGGLSNMAENILHVKMDKNWYIRCMNWENAYLSERQIQYAANDAWVAVKIFEVLVEKLTWDNKYIIEWFKIQWHRINGKLPPPPLYLLYYIFVDAKFQKPGAKSQKRIESHIQLESSVIPLNVRQEPKKTPKVIPRAFCTRQSPLYHNCFMQAPDGAVLCTCDRKKAMWYVSKGLAELIAEVPLTVRLKFEPSGRAVGTVGQYYVQPKSNCCVVCGKVDGCIRKNIVPHEYRKHFPKVMKDHVSHDVLLLCLPCHLHSNSYDLALKRTLAHICEAPFCQGGNMKYNLNKEKSAVKAAAKALLRNANTIPLSRQLELQRILKEYFNAVHLTQEMLQEAAFMNTHTTNEEYDPHGIKVVQYFSRESNGGIVKLEQMWREHFLKTMHPKYMPNLWSVTHTQDRLAIRASENRVLANELCVAGMKKCVPLLENARTFQHGRRML